MAQILLKYDKYSVFLLKFCGLNPILRQSHLQLNNELHISQYKHHRFHHHLLTPKGNWSWIFIGRCSSFFEMSKSFHFTALGSYNYPHIGLLKHFNISVNILHSLKHNFMHAILQPLSFSLQEKLTKQLIEHVLILAAVVRFITMEERYKILNDVSRSCC